MRYGIGIGLAGHQTDEVSRVDHEDCLDVVGDLTESLVVELARVGRISGKKNLRPVLFGQALDLVHVDDLGVRVDAIGNDVVIETRKVNWRTMGEMAAVIESHPQHRVARFDQGEVDPHVGLGSGVGLDIGVFRTEERLGAGNRQ